MFSLDKNFPSFVLQAKEIFALLYYIMAIIKYLYHKINLKLNYAIHLYYYYVILYCKTQ